MRVLLDEIVPHDLVATLVGHDVVMDRKLERQHDISALPFGVVVVRARSSKMQDLIALSCRIYSVFWQPSNLGRLRALVPNQPMQPARRQMV